MLIYCVPSPAIACQLWSSQRRSLQKDFSSPVVGQSPNSVQRSLSSLFPGSPPDFSMVPWQHIITKDYAAKSCLRTKTRMSVSFGSTSFILAKIFQLAPCCRNLIKTPKPSRHPFSRKENSFSGLELSPSLSWSLGPSQTLPSLLALCGLGEHSSCDWLC